MIECNEHYLSGNGMEIELGSAASDTQVIKLGLMCTQTGFDVAQTLAVS